MAALPSYEVFTISYLKRSYLINKTTYICGHRRALLVQLYLRMDRFDLAENQVKAMKASDEDSTLTMLASAWTNLSSVRTLSIIGSENRMNKNLIREDRK